MKVGIPKEITPHERRVAASPESVEKIVKLGLEVIVQAGAGEAAAFPDAAFAETGAAIVPDAKTLYAEADIVLKVRPPGPRPEGGHEADLFKPGATLISFMWPAQNKELLERLAARKLTVLAMDAVPRITRAQQMDALSAMANVAGYRAVDRGGAANSGGSSRGRSTAAGRSKPAQVLVIGAGVAGLAAIAAARGAGRAWCGRSTRGRRRASRSRAWAGSSSSSTFKESGEGEGGYAKEMSDAYIAAEQALIAAARQGVGHRRSRRR